MKLERHLREGAVIAGMRYPSPKEKEKFNVYWPKVKLECAKFIEDLSKTQKNKKLAQRNLCWRGTDKYGPTDIVLLTPRQDRVPKDMEIDIHDYLNNEFHRQFGFYARSQGVFATFDVGTADDYGRPFIFFPVGNYKFLYNPEISDLYTHASDFSFDDSGWEDEFNNEYGEHTDQGSWYYEGEDLGTSDEDEAVMEVRAIEGWGSDEIGDHEIYDRLQWVPEVTYEEFEEEKIESAKRDLEYAVDGYEYGRLKQVTNKSNELMFKCKKYYLIGERYSPLVRERVWG